MMTGKPQAADIRTMEDFAAYADAQALLDQRYRDKGTWSKMSIHNIAQAGIFSSDRTIQEYSGDIWNIHPVEVLRGKHK